MNNQTYEQIVLNTNQVNEETTKFLQDGMEVSIEFYDEKPMTVNPPENLVVEIAETKLLLKAKLHPHHTNLLFNKWSSSYSSSSY